MVVAVARDTLSASNAAVVTRKLRERAELGGGVDDALFTPLVADDAYATRIEFLDALERYATALDELVSADRSKTMDKAVTKLAGALDAWASTMKVSPGKKNRPYAAGPSRNSSPSSAVRSRTLNVAKASAAPWRSNVKSCRTCCPSSAMKSAPRASSGSPTATRRKVKRQP